MFNYFEKYMKYKNKYLTLIQSGGGYKKNKKKSHLKELNSSSFDYEVHVSEPWYTHIKEGRKTVEGRPKRNTFVEMKVGQTVKFFNKQLNENFCAKIIEINEYKTFFDMIRSNGLENVLSSGISSMFAIESLPLWLTSKVLITKKSKVMVI
jgi:ASC-1-like (ASCH) protein